ncbi:hypothetical protein CC85DRAFT_172410 [Cutaneotrichosporon oleaginosum]|uniref:Uncharacterized protein n=1 Tax=Cutaneotrichosporon oleaginosum TaxID=879819 RepID=A0A0J0XVP4_9TREE|nr:uncharacterized protein CC85DRAFT_172410 [Cutaneotrichosporon oleaginosum]KLT45108.1 hypothetical protein CC85DRAFT_172410 [Cutaneotrichosporon oleaginosum]TXT09789.1 hypothetical protein COLE_03723 [Cutaneotrichosporon oleaginosum]
MMDGWEQGEQDAGARAGCGVCGSAGLPPARAACLVPLMPLTPHSVSCGWSMPPAPLLPCSITLHHHSIALSHLTSYNTTHRAQMHVPTLLSPTLCLLSKSG